MRNETVVERDFSDQKLAQLDAIGCRFERCRFERIEVEAFHFGSGSEISVYVGCTFDGARISAPSGGLARVESCSFRNCNLSNWNLDCVDLVNCVFSGRMEKAVIFGSTPGAARLGIVKPTNEIRGNDFRGMDLVDVSFRGGVDLSLQALPSGQDYVFVTDGPSAVKRARERIAQWAPSREKDTALQIIEAIQMETKRGQKQLFLRKSNYVLAPHEVKPVDLAFAELQ